MKIIFFGTPEYVLPVVSALDKTYNQGFTKGFIGVVTQSPKPIGREKIIIRSPIDNWAYKHNVRVFYDFNRLPQADLGTAAAYGKIIPKSVIENYKWGILNIHPSLLPQFRGPSPVQAAIVSNTTSTGVSVIKMDEKMDHGPIVSSFKENVTALDTTGFLRKRLFERAAEFLIDLIPKYLNGKINLKEQNHKKTTYTKIISKEDGFIPPEFLVRAMKAGGSMQNTEWKIRFIKDYSLVPSASSLERFVRAMDPWPICWTYVQLNSKSETRNPKRLKIIKSHVENEKLVLDVVQLEGKSPVTWKQFREGYPLSSFF